MHINLTYLKRLAFWMSAFVALAGTLPVAAMAAPEPVVKKVLPAPVAKKALPEPVRRRDDSHVTVVSAVAAPSIYRVPLGESRVYRFEQPIRRVAVGDPKVADYIMLNRSEVYLLGKKLGTTNLDVWYQNGNLTSTPVQVSRNIKPILDLLKVVLPGETDIQIFASGPALVLSGMVSNTLVAETVSRLVTAYLGGSVPKENPESALIGSDPAALIGILGDNNKVTTPVLSVNMSSTPGGANSIAGSAGADSTRGVVNLLRIRDPQQVRLEVCIAQVSRTFLESLGVSFLKNSGDIQGGSLLSGFVSNATLNNLLLGRLGQANGIKVVANRKPSLFKVLAEPTIVTMSGKEGYFLVGGKVYLPASNDFGRILFIERTYGVGLRFTPVVLDTGRISLKVVPEVSEPDKQPLTVGTTTNFPSFKVSTVSTTVQMKEGENLVIGGLMLDNFTNLIDEVPLLGEIPILGALFRDTQKNAEKTELMVIVRPTLVKASSTMPELPTDKFISPTSGELFLNGKLHGSRIK